jgi:hypothetical protein
MIEKQLINSSLYILLVIGFISCKTYYIPVESFKAQFKGIDSTKLKLVYTQNPYGFITEYLANPIDYIKCVDKENNPFELKNGPSVEIQFTETNNKRTVYYFDRLILQDTLIIGERSKILGLRKGISINNVKMIEVQDGQKKFKYVDKKK